MVEYINREAALKVLAAGRGCGNICSRAIKNIPAADVVEVVRCKDCKYCDFGEWQFAVCTKRSEYHNFTVRKNEFCNFGKRRENNEID